MERFWPTAVSVNPLFDLIKNADGFADGNDDLLIVLDVLSAQYVTGSGILTAFTLPILEPFLADLVAADVKVPHLLSHSLKATGLVLVQPDCLTVVRNVFDLRITTSYNGGRLCLVSRKLH